MLASVFILELDIVISSFLFTVFFIEIMAQSKPRKTPGEGSYNLRKTDVDSITFPDFQNPWTFHFLFTQNDPVLFRWLRDNGLLAEIIHCRSGETAKLQCREKAADNFAFRCKKGHEYTMRKVFF